SPSPPGPPLSDAGGCFFPGAARGGSARGGHGDPAGVLVVLHENVEFGGEAADGVAVAGPVDGEPGEQEDARPCPELRGGCAAGGVEDSDGYTNRDALPEHEEGGAVVSHDPAGDGVSLAHSAAVKINERDIEIRGAQEDDGEDESDHASSAGAQGGGSRERRH